MSVEYRLLADHPGYRVGSDGSVWSCLRRTSFGPGTGSFFVTGNSWRRLAPVRRKKGYLWVNLAGCQKAIHSLVLSVFVGPCPDGLECCHGDGDPANNRLDNLRWGTRLSNHADQDKHGTRLRGDRSPRRKLTEEDVRSARSRYDAGGVLMRDIAADLGVSITAIKDAIRRKTWAHVA